jgi:hypothetical protein
VNDAIGAMNAFNEWRDGDTDTLEVVVQREHLEPGRSFSVDAMRAIANQLTMFVGARILRRWNDTEEPPTVVNITVTVSAQ